MENLKHHVDKVDDENKAHMKRKEHRCKFNHIANVSKTQSKMKIFVKNIILETRNLKHHVYKVEDENKAHKKSKEHHCETNHVVKATKT